MSVRSPLAVILAAWVAGCAAAAPSGKPVGAKSEPHPASPAVALRNPGFENAPRPGERCAEHWECAMHNNPDAFSFRVEAARPAEGRQSLCIERVHDEPWAIATQSLQAAALRGKRLRLSIAVRVERADGAGAGAGPWILVHGPSGNLAHDERVLAATDGWQRVSLDFAVGATAQLVEVGATLQGAARACIDDARLQILD